VSISAEFTAETDPDIENLGAFDHMGFVKLLAGMESEVFNHWKNPYYTELRKTG